jgi:putative peptidoglycan lipid II flippase
MTIIGGLMAVLHVRDQFARPQLTHVVPTLTVVAFVVARSDWGTSALLRGLFCGLIAQCGLLLGMLIRNGYRPRLVFDPLSPAGRRLLHVGVSLAVIDGLVQANVFVDRWMAGSLAEGRISVLYWSALMKDFFTITLLMSLMSVLIPHFSRQVAENRIEELRHSCALVLRYGALLMFPLSAIIAVCGPVLLSQLKLGALAPDDASAIGWCLAAYSLGLFAELAGPILSQVLVACGRLRVMLLISIGASFLPNLVLNYLLIKPLGEVGLALSTAGVACLSMTCIYLAVRRTVGFHQEALGARKMAGCLGAAIVTAGVGYAVLESVRAMIPNESWTELAAGSAAVFSQVAIYAAMLFGYPGSDDARRALRVLKEKLRESLS